jgi:hypothetical protein
VLNCFVMYMDMYDGCCENGAPLLFCLMSCECSTAVTQGRRVHVRLRATRHRIGNTEKFHQEPATRPANDNEQDVPCVFLSLL